ncbi:MAG: hypothetical protein ACXVDI_22005, partial [Ktedonobacterales bacterium]
MPNSTGNEVDAEAILMVVMLVAAVEGVCVLAERNLVLLSAAFVLARSAFETGLRIQWLLEPVNPTGRYERWLA